MEENSEMIWRIWKKGKSNSDKISPSFHNFLLYFPNLHYSTGFSSAFSISFHYSTYFSSIFSISFHNILLYFPNLFTIQLTFLLRAAAEIGLKFHPKHVTNKSKTKHIMKISHININIYDKTATSQQNSD
jgi:hypothetical protein